jgi:TonB family protein
MRRTRGLLIALVVSLLLHVVAAGAGWISSRFFPPPDTIDFDVVTGENKVDTSGPIHVIDITRPDVEEEPEDARYAGLYDANPAEEMKPPDVEAGRGEGGEDGTGGIGAPGEASPVPPARASRVAPAPGGPRKDEDGGRTASLATPEYSSLGVGTLKLSLDDRADGADDGVHDGAGARRPGGGVPGTPGAPAGDDALMPGPADTGLDHEYLPDVAEGPGMLIKTKHYKFAGFFLRLKNDVERKWHAREAYMRHDPTGEVYGVKDRYTQLYVKLTKEGKVVDVAVAVSSGLDFLDTEAMSAIKNAQPFYHPPPGLADDDGFIRFYFGFYLYVSEPPRVNVFHY